MTLYPRLNEKQLKSSMPCPLFISLIYMYINSQILGDQYILNSIFAQLSISL